MGSSNRAVFVAGVFVVVLLAGGAVARAQEVVIAEPAGGFLDLGPVNIGATSATRRITLTNQGTADPRLVEVDIDNPAFAIVGAGGDLAPGHSAYWDIAVSPTDANCSSIFTYSYRDTSNEDRTLAVFMGCTARRSPFDAPDVAVPEAGPGATTLRRIPVVNTSGVAQTITGFTSTDAAFGMQLHDGSLPATIAPEATFELDIRFSPAAPQQSFDTFLGVTLADGGTAPIDEVFAHSSDVVMFQTSSQFDPVPVGQTWRVHADFANYTAAPVTLTGIAISNPAFTIEGIAPGDVLPALSTVPVYVDVKPTAAGALSASYTLTFDSAAPISDGWQAEGIAPQLRITTNDGSPDDGLLDFGEADSTSPPITRTMTLSNLGTQGIYVECQMFGSTGDGFTSASACPSLLWPGDSVDVAVTFTPTPSVPGALPDRRISAWRFTELGELHVVVELTAVMPSYHFVLSAYEVGFADTPPYSSAPTTADVVLTNTSLTPIPIPAATISGVGFSVVSAPGPGTLAPFATASYRVGFAPQAAGVFDGVLHLGGLADVPLHGAGIAREVTAQSALDFGEVAVGTSARRSVMIHNAGATAVAATMLVVADPQFHVIAPADAAIPAHGELAVALDFTPTAAGSITGRLDIGFDADPQPQLAVALTGVGVGVAAGSDGGVDGAGGGGGGNTGGCSTSGGGSSSIVLALALLGLVVGRRTPARGSCSQAQPTRCRQQEGIIGEHRASTLSCARCRAAFRAFRPDRRLAQDGFPRIGAPCDYRCAAGSSVRKYATSS